MSLNMVTVTFTVQDAGADAETGSLTVKPTSVVTASGVTVVSQDTVSRAFSAGAASVELVATDNSGTSPAAGFWAYEVELPGWAAPQLYLVDFAGGSTQRFDSLAVAAARTCYTATAGTAAWAGGTATEYVAPAVVALTDVAVIAVNAAAGNDFYVTLAGNRTMAVPSNPHDSQKITFEIIQDGTGNRTLTWTGGAGGYSFGGGSAPVLSTAAAAADQVAFRYSARKSQWLCLGSDGGF